MKVLSQLNRKIEELVEWLINNSNHPDYIIKVRELNNLRVDQETIRSEEKRKNKVFLPNIKQLISI